MFELYNENDHDEHGHHHCGGGGRWGFRAGRGRHGHAGWEAAAFGFGLGFGRGRGRGEMKFEILATLEAAPRTGYEVMLEIEKSSGVRPNPGRIYPALQMLEDGDFIAGSARADGKRVFAITDKGRELLAKRPENTEGDVAGIMGAMAGAIRAIKGIKDAGKQIARDGNPETIAKGVKILEKTRRELYALLSEEPADE